MDLTNALWITLIGMGLVFIAILLLWGLMALLVRITAEPEDERAVSSQPAAEPDSAPEDALLAARKHRAAAAAVAIALAYAGQDSSTASTSHEPLAAPTLNAWQSVNRSKQLGQRYAAPRRKVVR